jgi:hypothetical protein
MTSCTSPRVTSPRRRRTSESGKRLSDDSRSSQARLIACECHARDITPTYIAGFRAFLALNRCVRKGQTAIRILAPVAVKQRDDDGQETGEKRIFFRTVPVFDTLSRDRWEGHRGSAAAGCLLSG